MGAARRLPLSRLSPALALARAAALLESASRRRAAALAWSMTSASALILGRAAHDPPLDWLEVGSSGVSVHRRASGGGAVLWDDALLALDVALPPDHALVADDVVASYAWLGQSFAEGISSLGASDVEVVSVESARAQPRAAGLLAAACFGSFSPFEVAIGGRKVLGLSQVRRKHGTLLQAGLLLEHDSARLARLLGRERAAADLDAVTTGAAAHTGGSSPERLVAAVENALAGWLLLDDASASLDAAEHEDIARLAETRYGPIPRPGD